MLNTFCETFEMYAFSRAGCQVLCRFAGDAGCLGSNQWRWDANLLSPSFTAKLHVLWVQYCGQKLPRGWLLACVRLTNPTCSNSLSKFLPQECRSMLIWIIYTIALLRAELAPTGGPFLTHRKLNLKRRHRESNENQIQPGHW